MKYNTHIVISFFLIFTSCDYFKKVDLEEPIARVNDAFLYAKDIEGLISENTTKEDSILRVTNFINQWATHQLLINGAKINLPEEKQIQFASLVEQYKNDLFIKAYLEALVKRSMDTSITNKEVQEVYKKNIETFKLNEELIKFRYINLSDKSNNLKNIKERFKRFNQEDKTVLDSIAIQFKSYFLNDSIWVRLDQVITKIPTINGKNKKELLKKSNFIEFKDSLGLYLVQINKVLHRNEIAPLEYVLPTIKQIVINKRKLEYIKQLEKDITKDAIKNKQFEIFK